MVACLLFINYNIQGDVSIDMEAKKMLNNLVPNPITDI
jgi:hypothetical protein